MIPTKLIKFPCDERKIIERKSLFVLRIVNKENCYTDRFPNKGHLIFFFLFIIMKQKSFQ